MNSAPNKLTMSPAALLSTQAIVTPPPTSKASTSPIPWAPRRVVDPPRRTKFSFDSMDDALTAFANGEFVVVMDDEDRENEGDLIIAAALCTTEKMAWMIKHTRSPVLLLASASSLTLFPRYQRFHLRGLERRSATRTRNPDDGGRQPRSAQDGVYCDCRL